MGQNAGFSSSGKSLGHTVIHTWSGQEYFSVTWEPLGLLLSHSIPALEETMLQLIPLVDEKVQILISWLLMKPAHLDLHCFKMRVKTFEKVMWTDTIILTWSGQEYFL